MPPKLTKILIHHDLNQEKFPYFVLHMPSPPPIKERVKKIQKVIQR